MAIRAVKDQESRFTGHFGGANNLKILENLLE